MSSSLPRGAPTPTKTESKPLVEQRAQARDRRVVADVDAHVENDLRLVFEHVVGQPERRDVRAHESAGLVELLEHHDLVAERHQVVGDRERRRARPDAGDALAVLLGRDDRQSVGDVAFQVGRDALEATDGDRLSVDAVAAAGRLAGSVAGAPEDSREDVGLPVEHVGVVELALSDHPDVARHVGVRRTGPLAVHDLVVVVRVLVVSRLHAAFSFSDVVPRRVKIREGPERHNTPLISGL